MKRKEEKEVASDGIKHKIINSFYSNGIGSGYSSDDFFIDFVQYPAEDESGANTTRIYLTPKSFKEILIFLKERLDEYEKEYGEIKLEEEKKE